MSTAARLPTAPVALGLTLLPALLLAPASVAGQGRTAVGPEDLGAVFPSAVRFSDRRGEPPVFEAYRATDAGGEELAGYVFLTSDLPPEMTGYNGPVEVLVGMQLDGTIAGVSVLEYHESLRSTRGDFLARPRFIEQFAGKHVGDPFRVRDDVDGISGATITVRAMSLGVRNAARRVAAAYLADRGAGTGGSAARKHIATLEPAELAPLSWAELLEGGLGAQVAAGGTTVSFAYVRDDATGELLIGADAWRAAVEKAGERIHEHHVMVIGIDGGRALGPLPRVLFAQGPDTIRPTQEDLVDAGPITEGSLEGAFKRTGLLLVDHALDVSAPFEVGLGRCCGDPPVTAEYLVQEPVPDVPAAPVAAVASGASGDPATAGGGVPAAAAARPDEGSAAGPGRPQSGAPVPSAAEEARNRGAEASGVRVTAILLATGLAIAAVAAVASRARARSPARASRSDPAG